jgi:hypothetical protein
MNTGVGIGRQTTGIGKMIKTITEVTGDPDHLWVEMTIMTVIKTVQIEVIAQTIEVVTVVDIQSFTYS